MKKICLVLIIFISIFSSCKYKYIDDNKFIGTWELKGKNSFTGLQLNIQKEGEGFIGRIVTLPNNDLFKPYLKVNDIWITKIERTSNFEFKITEKKIASALFSEYDLPTTNTYKAEFISETKIGLAENDNDPKMSSISLEKVNI